ncbi:MAG: hypothetical protein IJ459_01865 [Clostridia bacterium]|nr:hypothetical protein [Clostridia bacterium]
MTVNEALLQVDGYLQNRVDEREKLVWLSRVEKRIIDEVHSRYPELARGGEFTGFTADNKETKLCVPMPYDELYVHFLAAEIQLKLHEQKHYNNEVFLYNSLLKDYKIMLNRRYRPGGVRRYKVR